MTTQNGNTAIKEFRDYARSDAIVERFSEVVGERNARAYITSVVLAVGNSASLQKCSNTSIMSAALQAAALRVSVDPQLRQAALVPYGDKATLILMFKGLKDMAVRTGKYRYIHVHQLHGAQTVEFDPFSGKPKLVGYGGVMEPVTGYLATFEMMNGFSKTIYMSVVEIHAHGKRYSKNYNKPDSLWQTNKPVMEEKTIGRRLLLHWGYMDPNDVAILAELDDHEFVEPENQVDYIDAEAEDVRANADTLVSEIVGETTEKTAGNARPHIPAVLRDALIVASLDYDDDGKKLTDGQARGFTLNLERVFEGIEGNPKDLRHGLIGFLFGVDSAADLTDGQKVAVQKWLNIKKDATGAFNIDPLAKAEAALVIEAVEAIDQTV